MGKGWRTAVGALLAAVSFGGAYSSAGALNPDRSIGQYKLTRWTPELGAPEIVFDVAQDRDGFLWMATRVGLYRFDGITFEHMRATLPGESSQMTTRLAISPRGEVWTWYRNSNRFAVYRDGAMRLLPPPPANGLVHALAFTRDGALWAGHPTQGAPLMRFRNGRWAMIGSAQGLPSDELISLVAHPDGSLWASYLNAIVRWAPGADRFETVRRLAAHEAGPIILDRQSRIWVTSERGTYLLADARGRAVATPALSLPAGRFPLRNAQLLFDRDGNLWGNDFIWGLIRVRPPLEPVRNPHAVAKDGFTTKEGLTSNLINDLFEDREGNLWIATTFGLNQLSDTDIVSDPNLAAPALTGDLLLSASDGSVYIAEQDTLYRVAPGAAPRPWIARTGTPRALCEAPDGSVVLVADGKFVRATRDRLSPVAAPPAVSVGDIGACAVDTGDHLWVYVNGTGFFRQEAGRWRLVQPAANVYGGVVIERHPDGGVLLSPDTARLVHIDNSLRRRTILKPDARYGPITGIHRTPSGIIVRTRNVIVRIGPKGIQEALEAQLPASLGFGGFVELADGTSWTFGSRGIARFRTADLERAFASPAFKPPTRLFDYSDGLLAPGTAPITRNVAAGSDGRLWFASDSIVMMMDSRHLKANRSPPGVRITNLTADARRTRDPVRTEVPAGTKELQIAFSALSLSRPQKTEVRYKLEGFDGEWVDPGRRREAYYTNLPPGDYTFRVIAANDDGVWNREGATLELTIPPTFVQSGWFKLLLALAAIALATIAYQLRVRQVTARLQGRFDARIAERERIARELHDTLLQGFQGLMLRFQAVANLLPVGADLRGTIDDALDRADAVLTEGRARVRELRVEPPASDLAQALAPTVSAIVAEGGPRPEVLVEGEARPLHQLVGGELQRIAEEAMRNAANHAKAGRIAVLIEYGRREFRMSVEDDGVGLPREVLATGGKDGRFGLTGMRERAARLGTQLVLEEGESGGTRVSVTLPARAAYVEAPLSWRRFTRVFSGWRR